MIERSEDGISWSLVEDLLEKKKLKDWDNYLINVDASNYVRGIYFVKIHGTNSTIQPQRIVIN